MGVRGTALGMRSVARSRQHGSSGGTLRSLVARNALQFICVGPGSTPRCPSGTPSMSPQKGSPGESGTADEKTVICNTKIKLIN